MLLLRRIAREIRAGLTVIEVLTSLTVAIIGVFGVMSLIPFAVRQTQTGLDLDAGNQFGRNAQEQFEAFSYNQPFDQSVILSG